MHYYLGVDVGGTKTHALVADETGRVLGFGEAGTGNHEMVGYEGLAAALKKSAGAALESAGLLPEQMAGAGFGVAGYDWLSELDDTLRAIGVLNLNSPVKVVNDAIIGLVAGAEQGWGIVLVAGTGNNCAGRNRLGQEGRITGNGMMFGEYGGGGDLVYKALHAINHEWIRRGPTTRVTEAFVKLAGAKDATDLIEGLVMQRYRPRSVWALEVFRMANEGDPVAIGLIHWLGTELGESACGVIRQIGIEAEEFEAVMVGSVFEGGPLFIEPLRKTIQKVAPRARLVRLEAPPVVGGVLLGMEAAGVDGRPVRVKLIEGMRGWRDL